MSERIDPEEVAKEIFLKHMSEMGLSWFAGRIANLTEIAAMFREIAQVNGGVGLSVFSNALRCAETLEQAAAQIQRVRDIARLQRELEDHL